MGEITGKHWYGWTSDDDEDFITDENGNHYWQAEIRALFYLRQLHGSQKNGLDKKKIRSLREHLDDEIIKAKKRNRITIAIDWGDEHETIVHPYFRKASTD